MTLVLFCTWEDKDLGSLKLALRYASFYLGPVTQSLESYLFFSILNSPQGALLEELQWLKTLAEAFIIYEMAGGILCPQAKA